MRVYLSTKKVVGLPRLPTTMGLKIFGGNYFDTHPYMSLPISKTAVMLHA